MQVLEGVGNPEVLSANPIVITYQYGESKLSGLITLEDTMNHDEAPV